MSFNRNVFTDKALSDAAQQSYETRDDRGNRRTYIDIEALPVPLLRIGNGEHYIDHIPTVAGENHPSKAPGTPIYVLLVFSHTGLGPNRDDFLCMAATYGKPCAACDRRNMLLDAGFDWNDIPQKYKSSKRGVYYVLCRDNQKMVETGLQVMELSHYLYEHNLSEQAKIPVLPGESPEGGLGFRPFASPEHGDTVYFKHVGKQLKSRIEGIQFIPRKFKIPDAMLETTFNNPLDRFLIFPDQEEIRQLVAEPIPEKGAQQGGSVRAGRAKEAVEAAMQAGAAAPGIGGPAGGDDQIPGPAGADYDSADADADADGYFEPGLPPDDDIPF